MAKAKKLPSGSWRVQVFAGVDANGKRLYKSFTASTERKANLAAMEWQEHYKEISRDKSNMTVKEAMEAYISAKSNVLSPSTIREYRRTSNNDLKQLHDKKLSGLTQSIIQAEINREAMTHSPKSVRNMHGFLSAVLSVYMPNMRLYTTLPQKVKSQLYVPSDNDISRLISSLDHSSDLFKAVILAAFGSLRRSEICALTSKDINGNTVSVNKAMVQNSNKEWVIKPPKTFSSYRDVDLSEDITKLLASDGDMIVSCNPNAITKSFKRALEKNRIPHFRFHDLRHYQASILHALGIPDKYIAARGGWKTDNTLKKIYQHTMDAKTAEVNQVINNHFDALMQHEKQHED